MKEYEKKLHMGDNKGIEEKKFPHAMWELLDIMEHDQNKQKFPSFITESRCCNNSVNLKFREKVGINVSI